MLPSEQIAGDESTSNSSSENHFSLPSGFSASNAAVASTSLGTEVDSAVGRRSPVPCARKNYWVVNFHFWLPYGSTA